jgi:hypothetical protein
MRRRLIVFLLLVQALALGLPAAVHAAKKPRPAFNDSRLEKNIHDLINKEPAVMAFPPSAGAKS